MSIALIIERRGVMSKEILVEEWMQFIANNADIRLRENKHVAINPLTGQHIALSPVETEADILINGKWLPFLQYRRGTLFMKYQPDFENPQNEMRIKIIYTAKALNARIGTDVDDDALNWDLS